MNKGLCTKLTASITLALAAAAYAQPANDTCAGATAMFDGSNNWSNVNATQDTTISCAFGGAGNSGLDVWYTYTAPATSTRDFIVNSFTTGDSTLAIYDVCGGTELACNDDFTGLLSRINGFPVTAGTTYRIRLSGWGTPGGTGTGVLTIAGGAPPAGSETCATAQLVTDGSYAASTGSSTEVTPACGFGGANDSWFRYVAPGNGVLTVDMCAGATHDTILTAYAACGGAAIACNDDFCGLSSSITFPITSGTTYYVAYSGYNNSNGSGTITFSSLTGGPPANDNCATATTITPGTAVAFNNSLATTDGPSGSCNIAGNPDGNDLWYNYTATLTGVADIEVLDTFGLADSTLQVYDVCGGTELACNDDNGFSLLSRIAGFPVTSGTNYKIRVAGWGNPPAVGAAELLLTQRIPTAFDDCALATPVAGDITVAFDTNGLTTDGGDCIGTIDGWYSWTPSTSGAGVVSTCGLTADDTTLAAYDSCGGTQIACLDDFCGLQTQITFPVSAGVPVIVRLASFGGVGMTGQISFATALPPANDNCAGATVATLGSNAYDSTAAGQEGPSGSCNFGGTPDNADVFFRYTAGAEGFITVDTLGGGIFDTTLQIFDVCGGTELACNDDAGGGLQSQICTFPVVSGTTYIIRAASWGAAGPGGQGVVNIAAASGPVIFSPPPEAISEPEVCGTFPDVDNGGCNSDPNSFTNIELCDTYKGTGYFDGAFRDTDWYKVTVSGSDTITVTGESQFNALIGILEVVTCGTPNDPNDPPVVNFLAFDFPTAACGGLASFTLSAPVSGGEYIVFVAPTFDAVFACGNGADQYWFNVTGEGECGPTCNDIDFNNDGSFFDPQDVDAFLSVYGEGPCIPGANVCDSIDFNNDGSFFDPCDIDSFLVVFGEGPCTLCGE